MVALLYLWCVAVRFSLNVRLFEYMHVCCKGLCAVNVFVYCVLCVVCVRDCESVCIVCIAYRAPDFRTSAASALSDIAHDLPNKKRQISQNEYKKHHCANE